MDVREIHRICGSFRTRLKALQLQAGLARMAIVALLILPPVMALDWWVHLDWPYRLLALVAWLAALGTTAWWTVLRPLKRGWSDREVLTYLDAVAPAGQGMLTDLAELVENKGIHETTTEKGRELAEAAKQELARLPQQVSFGTIFAKARVLRWVGVAGVLAGCFALGALASGEYFAIGVARFFNPFSRVRWPHRTTIEVKNVPDEGKKVPQLESFTIEALVTGEVPPQVTLEYESKSTGYTIKEKVSVADDGTVKYTYPEIREPLEFRIRGGDYDTDWFEISVVARPFVEKITAAYEYPVYAKLPPKTAESGQLTGLEGTKVKLSFEMSMALEKALYVPNQGEPVQLTKAGETAYAHEIMLKNGDTGYEIQLFDANGYRESRPERHEIRVMPDNIPEVELLSPGQDLVATRTVGVEVAFRARDDFGLEKVEFLYSLNNEDPKPLSDRVTGPITQEGRNSEQRFAWDLRKMEDLPESGTLNYWVRVKDINPTGRGVQETTHMQIKLVKPSEFHLEVFEQAKGVLNEAMIAWRNQLEAWQQARQWQGKGTGKEEDEIWVAMQEKQDTAIRAARAMQDHMQTLIERYESNHMDREFMSARITQVAGMLKKVTDGEHPKIATALRKARPKTQSEAGEANVKNLRKGALGEANDPQRLAIHLLDSIVRRVFDWRDLQTATISTTQILEGQEEVTDRTEKIAPVTIGKEFEDLDVETQDKLQTLGKQQASLFDAETQLETLLSGQMYKAQIQKRNNIRAPLESAFNALRTNRVNDSLKEASRQIADNQPSQIIKKQKNSVQILRAVKGGLVLAGAKVEPEENLVAGKPIVEDPKFEVAEKKPEVASAEEPASTDPADPLSEQDLIKQLPTGSDPVSTLLSMAREKQDDVLARSTYLAEKDWQKQMPRFLTLRTNLLCERQDLALDVMKRGIEEAAKAKEELVEREMNELKNTFEQSRQLIEKRLLSEGVRQLQDDSIKSLDDLIQFVAFKKSLNDAVAENKNNNGLDAFQRQFLVRDKDLDASAQMIRDLQDVYVTSRVVMRRVKRFAKNPPKNGLLGEVEKSNRDRSAARLKESGAKLAGALALGAQLTDEVKPQAEERGLNALKDLKLEAFASDLLSGSKDAELGTALDESQKTMGTSLQALRDLLEERVKPKEEPKPDVAEAPISAEEFEEARTGQALADRIKANPNIPEHIKAKMLDVLKKDFPAKYKELLIEYYNSFAEAEAAKP